MKLAIIGAGISGLATAWLLRNKHELSIFEAAPTLGGHSHTVSVAEGKRNVAIDTGFIVYNHRTYPNFIRLLSMLGLAGQATDMSFSVSDASSGLEYCSRVPAGLFAQRRQLFNPRYLHMLLEVKRFQQTAKQLLVANNNEAESLSLQHFLQQEGFSDALQRWYIAPMVGAIWSTPPGKTGEFPAAILFRFLDHHGLLSINDQPQWLTLPGGSTKYVERIAADLSQHKLHCNTAVRGITRNGTGVTLQTDTDEQRFDEVVIACHSDQALQLLGNASDAEQQILSAIQYQENETLLHTDARVMPKTRRAWAAWNCRSQALDDNRPMQLSYHMNNLQNLDCRQDYFVSLNLNDEIPAEHIIQRLHWAHPQFTLAAAAAQQRRAEISGHNRSHYCGAYWYNGFHEDGMRSAVDVANQLGADWSL